MSKKFLYSRLGFAVTVILGLSAVVVPRSLAQGVPQLKRPNDAPEEKPVEPPKKKVKGPRAVGILQLSSGGKSTLVPVAILVDGKFYDASEYKADPVPMALERGTVYEAEQSGESLGLFTINGALHSKNPASASQWIGAGSYLAQGAEAPKTTHKAEDVPVGLDTSGDEPPRLTRGNASKAGADSNPNSTKAGAESSGKTGAGTASSPTSPQAGSSPGGGNSGQDEGKKAPAPAPDKNADQGAKGEVPTGQKSADQKAGGQSSGDEGQAGQKAENYYRPTLRRGKPTQAAPEEVEEAPKVENVGSAATAGGAASPGPVQLVAAISDGGGPEPQSYKFYWKEGEEFERRKQMLDLAAREVQAYMTARAKGLIPAKPAAKATVSNHKAAAKPAQPVFENIHFHAFDVWKNSQPVMILSAEAHFNPTPGVTTAPETYSITLVTRTDIYGNLRKLYSGVTDKFHLDVTPRLELIDVVDADGDGRGELLFRETTDAGSGYAIYRATGDKLWKMFDSMGE